MFGPKFFLLATVCSISAVLIGLFVASFVMLAFWHMSFPDGCRLCFNNLNFGNGVFYATFLLELFVGDLLFIDRSADCGGSGCNVTHVSSVSP